MKGPLWHVFPRRTWRGLRYYFNFHAGNGEILLQSEAYRNRIDALRTLELVKREGGLAKIFVEPTGRETAK